MTPTTDSYSRSVALLKVALPLVALLILSTVFLLARKPDISNVLPVVEDDDALGAQTGLSRPSFAGVASDGSAVTMVARVVRPDAENPQHITATGIQARIERDGGERIDLAALEATMDIARKAAALGGGVSLQTSNGYLVQTAAVDLSLETSRIETRGEVGAETPVGDLTAGRMLVEPREGLPHLLVFNDGVRLIYDPKGQR